MRGERTAAARLGPDIQMLNFTYIEGPQLAELGLSPNSDWHDLDFRL
jgi:hypothetical protein